MNGNRNDDSGVVRDALNVSAGFADVDENLAKIAVGKKSGGDADELILEDQVERQRHAALRENAPAHS